MQVDKARLDEMLASIPRYPEGDERNVWAVSVTGTDLVAIITELLELRSLRSAEGKEGDCDPDGCKAHIEAFMNRAEAAEAHVAKLEAVISAASSVIAAADAWNGNQDREAFNGFSAAISNLRSALTRSPE